MERSVPVRRAMPVSKKSEVKKPEEKKVELTQEQLDMQKYLGFIPEANAIKSTEEKKE